MSSVSDFPPGPEGPTDSDPPTGRSSDPVDTAWKIHSAVVDWTGKVDTKASFTLTIETAVLAGIVTLSSPGRALSDPTAPWGMSLYVVGIGLLVIAMLMAVWVVRPRLRWHKTLKSEASKNFIYFGHLRILSPEDIEQQLRVTDLVPVLSKQLHETGKIAWKKHRWVQWSMSLAPIGITLVSLSCIF